MNQRRNHVQAVPRLAAIIAGVVTIIAGIAACPADAQAQPATTRPRVGLALGGGAARGLAHLGVLNWLDEHRVPVDMVGGTSMGALVGGAFATGMTPAEIRQLVDGMNWADVLAPDVPFKYKTFRRKQDTRTFPSSLEFGLRGGFRLPAGLSPGQQVELLLGRIAMPYFELDSFDDLPTPFRCVATDLRKAETVVFDRGWIAQALRASMAIPGLFAPVDMGDRVLVDGGVLNNVPADVVRAMGAQVVVAVDVSADLTHQKHAESLFSVLGETLDVMMRGGTRRALLSADRVIVPNLKGLSGTNFHRIAEFVRLGYEAAEAQRAFLEQYAVTDTEYRAYLEARKRRRRTTLPVPAFIRVEGVQAPAAADIRGRLAVYVGHPLDTALLERALTLLTGSERYLSVTYRLVDEGGRAGILVTVKPKTYGPPFLLASLDLQNARSTSMTASIRGRLVMFDVLGAGSEGRVDLGVGKPMKAAVELYRPLGRSGLFVAPRAGVEQNDTNLFVQDEFRAEYRRKSASAGLDVGITTERRAELRVGFDVEHVEGHVRIGDPLLPEIHGQQQYFNLQATFDGQTGPTIPERGTYARMRARRFLQMARLVSASGASAPSDPGDLTQAEADASVFQPVGRRGRIFLRGAGGSSFGSTTVANAFTLGGPLTLGALNPDQLRGSNYVLANAGYFHRVARLAQGAAGTIYLGTWIESGSAFERMRFAAFTTDVSAGLVIETPLGPIFAGASVALDGRYRLYGGLGPLLHR